MFKIIIPLSVGAMTKVGPGAQVKSMGGQVSEQVSEQDREQVGEQDEWIVRLSSMTKMDIGPLKKLLEFCKQPRSRAEMQEFCNVKSRSYFLINILKPLIAENVLLMTLSDKPNSRLQKYCLSESFGK